MLPDSELKSKIILQVSRVCILSPHFQFNFFDGLERFTVDAYISQDQALSNREITQKRGWDVDYEILSKVVQIQSNS
jgi:hypothetical protein